jgi:hypothetical protein
LFPRALIRAREQSARAEGPRGLSSAGSLGFNNKMADTTIKVKTAHIDMGPTGFIIYAQDFLNSFKAYSPEKPFSPAKYYLVCRSIELSLKSFLSIKNIPVNTIKDKLGHNLTKILNRTQELDIKKVVVISTEEVVEIKKANNWYNRKGFEYFDIKNIVESKETLPNLNSLQLLAERLIEILKPLCLASAQKP